MKRYAKLSATILFVAVHTANASLIPLTLTGWTADLIAENTASSPAAGPNSEIIPPGGTGLPGVSQNVGWVFYESGAPGSSEGLATDGQVTSSVDDGATFQLQRYGENDVVVNSGTLMLTDPAPYTALSFLTSAQGASGESFQLILNFSDGSTDVLTGSDPDWVTPPYAAPNAAINDAGLVLDQNSWSLFSGGYSNMYEHDYTLPIVDQTKTLDSITLTKTAGNYEMLFAIDGDQISSAPEPSSFLLLAGASVAAFIIWFVRGASISLMD